MNVTFILFQNVFFILSSAALYAFTFLHALHVIACPVSMKKSSLSRGEDIIGKRSTGRNPRILSLSLLALRRKHVTDTSDAQQTCQS